MQKNLYQIIEAQTTPLQNNEQGRLFNAHCFPVATFLMSILMFFCSIFERFNEHSYLFMAVFFFISGFNLEKAKLSEKAIIKLRPYLLFFALYALLFFGISHQFLPTLWFLAIYFLVSIFYRISTSFIFLIPMFVGLFCAIYFLDFSPIYYSSFFMFLFGVFFARYPKYYHVSLFLYMICLAFITLPFFKFANLFFVPLFVWFVLWISSFKFMSKIEILGLFSVQFYLTHYFAIYMFRLAYGFPFYHVSIKAIYLAFLSACFLAIIATIFHKKFVHDLLRL